MAKKLIHKKATMVMFAKKRQVKALPYGPLMGHQMQKGNKYLHLYLNARGETESLLTETKDTMNILKALASHTFSREILDFLKEKYQRQAARDDTFFKIIEALVQQPHPVVLSPVITPMSEPGNKFWYGMMGFRPNSSMVSYQGSMQQKLSGSQQKMSFMQQMNNPKFP